MSNTERETERPPSAEAQPMYDDGGLECCIDCTEPFGGETATLEVNHTSGPVYTVGGTKHEMVLDTDPGSALLCPSCHEEREIKRREQENQSLGEFR